MYVSSPSTVTNSPTKTTLPQQDLSGGKHWYFGEGLLRRCKIGNEVGYMGYEDYTGNLTFQIHWINARLTTSKARLESSSTNLTEKDIQDLKITIDQFTVERARLGSELEKANEELFHMAHQVSQKYHNRIFHHNWAYYHLGKLQEELEKGEKSIHTLACLNKLNEELEEVEKSIHTLAVNEIAKNSINDQEEIEPQKNIKELEEKKARIIDSKKAFVKDLQQSATLLNDQEEIEPQKNIKELEEKRERIIDSKIAFLQHLQQSATPLKFPQMWIPKT